ncbi:hypothetical protein [Pseudomonas aeruginosa]|uniref:hypothetical protein n=1 Tax=Pseudomonas aeruginosa TaxID=287 RepID=UPI0009418BB2|nr:hypothetical protein [Pseudomonas aeruginosa]OKS33364.1 hypothetical protein BH608_18060 [Pseudomonas aeruginosa]
MSSAKKGQKASSQYLTEQAAVRLVRLAARLGVAQGRVLDALLSARSDEQLAAFVEAQEYRVDPARPVPVLLDGPVVASMAGAITQSVSSLLGSALPDLAAQVLATLAERRPEAFAGVVSPVVDRLVPHVLDRLINEINRAELP